MDIFLCIMIFLMGTVFGSFFTLAVYRIPLKKDITHERSFCPNCNHRLEFLDLIPILSYIALGGKCRYCGQKIRIRYLMLETLSGIVFLFAFLSLNNRFPYYEASKFVYLAFFIFMYITLAITIGIDNEKKKIHMGVITFGVICQIVYIVYLYIFELKFNIYRYGIYILLIILLFVIRRFIKNNKYLVEILILVSYINLCIGTEYTFITLIISSIVYFIQMLIKKIRKNRRIKLLNIGAIIGICTVIVEIVKNYYIFY